MAAALLYTEQECLVAIISQDAARRIFGHRGELAVTLVEAEITTSEHRLQQDLEIYLVVGHVNAGGIVDRVGVDPAAPQGVFNASFLGQAEIAAFDHNFATEFTGWDSTGVGRMVAHLCVGFVTGADVGPD